MNPDKLINIKYHSKNLIFEYNGYNLYYDIIYDEYVLHKYMNNKMIYRSGYYNWFYFLINDEFKSIKYNYKEHRTKYEIYLNYIYKKYNLKDKNIIYIHLLNKNNIIYE
jgi:hypothetical protein